MFFSVSSRPCSAASVASLHALAQLVGTAGAGVGEHLDDLVLVDAGLQHGGPPAASVDEAAMLSPIRMPRQRRRPASVCLWPSSTCSLPEIRRMTRVITSAPAPPPCRNRCCARPPRRCSTGRARHVGDGDEPPRQGVHVHPRRSAAPLRELLDAGQLQDPLHAGWCDRRERHRADEPAARLATSADYIDTGEWSKRSIQEAGKYCTVNIAASSRASGYTHIPPRESWKLDPNAAYVHICANETIGGVEYHFTPEVGDVPAGGGRVEQHPRARSTSRSTA